MVTTDKHEISPPYVKKLGGATNKMFYCMHLYGNTKEREEIDRLSQWSIRANLLYKVSLGNWNRSFEGKIEISISSGRSK